MEGPNSNSEYNRSMKNGMNFCIKNTENYKFRQDQSEISDHSRIESKKNYLTASQTEIFKKREADLIEEKLRSHIGKRSPKQEKQDESFGQAKQENEQEQFVKVENSEKDLEV